MDESIQSLGPWLCSKTLFGAVSIFTAFLHHFSALYFLRVLVSSFSLKNEKLVFLKRNRSYKF